MHGEIRDLGAVAEAMRGCQFVINFAAESHVDRSIETPGEFIQTDVYGVFVLCEEARRVGVKRFIQVSTDEVYGEVLDSLHLSRLRGMESEEHASDLQRALMEFLESQWREPDEGLWEVRGPRRHFVHSKVMAWVAADRAVSTVEEVPGLGGDAARWRAMRAEVHDEVCRRGYDAVRGTFTQFYGSAELDASTLLIPQVGFLPHSDPRVVGTVDAVRRELQHGGFVRRYTIGEGVVDGLPGSEGAFLACSFWLADALHATGRTRQARELFETLLSIRNDVGLLAEEWDPVAGRQLGNFPQAFSHLALVNSASVLHGGRTREQKSRRDGTASQSRWDAM